MTIGFGVWNEKRVSTNDVTMRGLGALCDEGWAVYVAILFKFGNI
jgi:hypothetical protein